MSGVRRRFERAQGFVFDGVLIATATLYASPTAKTWLVADADRIYYAVALLHLITCPALLVAVIAGYGRAGTREELERRGPGVLGWAVAMLWGASFIIPAVLGLLFDPPVWLFMTTVFGPLVVFVLWIIAMVVAERRGWVAPLKLGVPKPWWRVQLLALFAWSYLIALEMMLLEAATREGPLVEVGLPLGVLIDYVPVRIVMYYVRMHSRWEAVTIAASVLYLLVRLSSA